MTRCRMAGGTLMLIAGELAVRRVSEIEATPSAHATNFNFKLISRTQVRCTHRRLPCVGVFMGTTFHDSYCLPLSAC